MRERDAWRDQVNIRMRFVNFIELWWWPLVHLEQSYEVSLTVRKFLSWIRLQSVHYMTFSRYTRFALCKHSLRYF